MALEDLRILAPDLWEKFKQQEIPGSAREGTTSAFDALVAPKDSLGRKLLLGASDTMDALRGDPRGSREGLEPRSLGDTAFRVGGDVSATLRGQAGPTFTDPIVGEPSTYEKIISPIADISSILHGRGLPSRKAALRRDELQLEEAGLAAESRKRDFSELNSFMEMNRKAIESSRDLSPEQQSKSLHMLGDFLDEEYGPGAGAFVNQEADFAGSTPDDMNQLFAVSPAAEAVYQSGGRNALQDFLTDQGNMDDITAGLDAQALGPVMQLWGEGVEPFMSQFHPKTMERLMEGGLDMGEAGEILKLVPETMVPQEIRPELMAWLERNSDKVGFLESPDVTEAGEKKRAEKAAAEPFEQRAKRQVAQLRREEERGINVMIPGMNPADPQAMSNFISYDGGRTVMMNGMKRSVEDFPGARIVGQTIQASGVEGLEARRESKAKEEALDIAAKVARGEALLQQVEKVGWRAVGPIGAATEKVTGFIGGFNPPAGEKLAKWITGVSQAEQSAMKVAAKSFAVQTIAVATGEEGARKTQYEQRLGDQVSKVSDPYASFEQIRGAIGGVMGVWLTNLDKANIEAGTPLEHNLETDSGRDALFVKLIRAGLSDLQVSDTVKLIQAQRRWLEESAGAVLNYAEPGG